MYNLERYNINELIKQKETHRLREQTYGCQRRIEGRDSKGVWDGNVHTTIFEMDSQQRPTA